ncbi:hypothetical protein [Streptomyces lasiicapitis]|uniref:hypothetical protein n=1 Tax=Streptomyces lasiicapitis TaxID=1923961 RepID=UPI00367EF574
MSDVHPCERQRLLERLQALLSALPAPTVLRAEQVMEYLQALYPERPAAPGSATDQAEDTLREALLDAALLCVIEGFEQAATQRARPGPPCL